MLVQAEAEVEVEAEVEAEAEVEVEVEVEAEVRELACTRAGAGGAGSTRLQLRMRAASLRLIAASKPPACFVNDMKLGILKTPPAPLRPAPSAAACFMASGFCATLLPTWSTPLSAYAAPATPQPRTKADVMWLGVAEDEDAVCKAWERRLKRNTPG